MRYLLDESKEFQEDFWRRHKESRDIALEECDKRMIRLTDEQIGAIDIDCGMSEIDGTEPFSSYKYEHHLLKAQLKKVVEWRNEECTEHSHTINISGVDHKMIVMHNDCEECWQSLLEEVNG